MGSGRPRLRSHVTTGAIIRVRTSAAAAGKKKGRPNHNGPTSTMLKIPIVAMVRGSLRLMPFSLPDSETLAPGVPVSVMEAPDRNASRPRWRE